MTFIRRPAWLGAVGLVTGLAACSIIPDTQPSRLYTLDTVAPLQSASCPANFSVRDFRVAGHLDREEMVVAREGPEVKATASDLWASPLKVELPRVLTRSLLVRWNGSRATPFPWRFNELPRAALNVDVDRLEPVGDQLNASFRWSVSDPALAHRLLDSGIFETRVPTADRSAGATALAINQALGRFADALAERSGAGGPLNPICSDRPAQPLDSRR